MIMETQVAVPYVHHHNIWIAYFAGFILTLAWKLASAIYQGNKQGKPWRQTTLEWFLEPSLSNASSWTATIGGVWLLGSIYINRIVEVTGLSNLPLDTGLAFFMGTIFEFTVPAITKWVVAKIPSA